MLICHVGNHYENQQTIFGSTEHDIEISREWLRSMPDTVTNLPGDARVLIKVQFKESPVDHAAAFRKWLQDIPTLEQHFKVEALFHSN